MRSDKEKAFELRRQGKSYRDICANLGMSKSTLSSWFKGIEWSEEIGTRLSREAGEISTIRIKNLNKERGDTLKAWYAEASREATLELERFKEDPLFISALMAYWGEGDKLSKNHVRITNTDPVMLALFRKFILEYCDISDSKIHGALFLYEDLDEDTCKAFWMKHTGITTFHKTMILPGRHKTRRLPYGTCTMIISNTYLKKKINIWIDLLPKMILNSCSSDSDRYADIV